VAGDSQNRRLAVESPELMDSHMHEHGAKPIIFRLRNSSGYTLVEVLVAVVFFALGILSLYRLQAGSVQTNSQSNMITQATLLAQSRMEQLLALPYLAPPLLDTDRDGTNQDPERDLFDNVTIDGSGSGLAETSGFGLSDTNGAGISASDGSDPLNPINGIYSVYWNIAVDYQVADTKTIRVIVTWRDVRGIIHRVVVSDDKLDKV